MAKFCAECGTELVRNNVCDKCKKAYLFENAGSTKICPICGFDAVYQGKCMNCNNIIDEQADWHKSTGTDNYGASATGGRQGNRFCKNCGTPVDGAGSFCTGCGMAVQESDVNKSNQASFRQYQSNARNYTQPRPKGLLEMISDKIQIEALIWAIVAGIQYLIGIAYLIFFMDSGMAFYGFMIIIIGGANTFFACTNYKYSKEILVYPVGIVDKYRNIGMLIGNMVYNILFGGVIGIAGSLYAFNLREFVLSNESRLLAIQHDFLEQENKF